jgi:hypothetical protein
VSSRPSLNDQRLDAVLAGDPPAGPSNVALVELIGVFEPRHKALPGMTGDEIEALAGEMYGDFVSKLDAAVEQDCHDCPALRHECHED